LWVEIVVNGNGSGVRFDLAQQHRFEKPPSPTQVVPVREERPQFEKIQKISGYIEVALDVGLSYVSLVQRAQCPNRAGIHHVDLRHNGAVSTAEPSTMGKTHYDGPRGGRKSFLETPQLWSCGEMFLRGFGTR